ncbi:MAG: hypothetical protein Q4D88_01245 [Anaerococcus sp.]|nr:hypothetical protein [Anaerococcus sp.]
MRKIIVSLIFLLALASCSYQSREDFEKDLKKEVKEEDSLAKEVDLDGLIYKSEGDLAEEFKDFKKSDLSNKRDLDKASGLIKVMDLEGLGLGFILNKEANSLNLELAYFKEKEDGSKEELRKNFGSISREDLVESLVNIFTYKSDSGPMLMVNIIGIYENETVSSYYLYNKYLSQMDSFVIRNYTKDINPSVMRMGEVVEVSDSKESGGLKDAINKRIKVEETRLKAMFEAYGLESQPLKINLDQEEIEAGKLASCDQKKDYLILEIKKDQEGIYIEKK